MNSRDLLPPGTLFTEDDMDLIVVPTKSGCGKCVFIKAAISECRDRRCGTAQGQQVEVAYILQSEYAAARLAGDI